MFCQRIFTSLRKSGSLSKLNRKSSAVISNEGCTEHSTKVFQPPKQSLHLVQWQALLTNVLPHNTFCTSTTLQKITDLKRSREIDSQLIKAGRKVFFLDLKSEEDGQLWLKVKEKSNDRTSLVLIELNKLPFIIKALEMAFTPDPFSQTPNEYATIQSKMFEHKTISFFARENAGGQYICIKEDYTEGIRKGMKSQILIPIEYLRIFIEGLQKFTVYIKDDRQLD